MPEIVSREAARLATTGGKLRAGSSGGVHASVITGPDVAAWAQNDTCGNRDFLPPGARILGAFVTCAAMGASVTLDVGLRAGTENVPGITGFGVAAQCAMRDLPGVAAHQAWRDAAEAMVSAAGATIIGQAAPRLPNTLFIAVRDWDSPQQLITLDLSGIMVSAGSACSSGKTKPSRAIVGMGRLDLATGGVRISGGWGTVADDWSRFAEAWADTYEKHRARIAARMKETA